MLTYYMSSMTSEKNISRQKTLKTSDELWWTIMVLKQPNSLLKICHELRKKKDISSAKCLKSYYLIITV